MYLELQFSLSALLYQVSRKYLEGSQRYQAYTISVPIITMRHNSLYIVYGITVLGVCTLSDQDLYLYQALLKYLERFESYIANTISILIIKKRYNSTDIACGVTVLLLLTLSYHGLHMYRVS